ncbi:SDR family NAD(P)-dependent oxidoreductase [Amycolatopsis australiensis]|uniref:2,5-dichloro-2,5-cyclohexadiene-1,4-diol dehydrogenase 1 n=1 Tax=Amycolatopsis australiensis TaxID=546364 RepID=A0A1K1S6U1_9PSEU|nr:glucose 1-dehydrogenase [Amycolatopsis australiensis]SFW79799.1 2,5-dichloro-2,5-cyclohexadiene-1,4-diol dehydrogenase 1 [Amycolatopsis australiensis]
MSGIAGRSIIVTGGASGIGEAAVRLFAENDALVTIADVHAGPGEALAAELAGRGHQVQFVTTDVTDEAQVAAMVAAAESAYGRLDGAFNNAGVPNHGKKLGEITREEFDRVFAVNVTGPFLCMKHEVPALRRAGGGSIVNTASVGAFVYIPLAAEYTASKHALMGLTKAAAAEYGEEGIRVNAIGPSTARTPMYVEYLKLNPEYEKTVAATHALRRGSEPVEQAQAAMWLLSDAAAFVTGVTLAVDGGYTLY